MIVFKIKKLNAIINYKKSILRAGVLTTGLLIALEIIVRCSGMIDFPIYDIDNGIGYIVKPNQSGAFLNKNQWAFNDRSMGTKTNWQPQGNFNLLLIGNSIVMGGNPFNQADKLGPILQKNLGAKIAVWPIAIGGWTNANESEYLQRNQDVVKANNFFVWEYMDGGLSGLSPDRGQYVFPGKKPIWASWYVFRRYILPKFLDLNMSELPPNGKLKEKNLQQFTDLISQLSAANGKKIPGIIFLYPGKDQYIGMQHGIDYVPDRLALEKLASTYQLKIVDVATYPEWNISLYREGTHPTVEGNKVLAKILSAAILGAL